MTNLALLLRKNIFMIILIMASISILLNFISSSWSRVFFFLTSYLSIISIILTWRSFPPKKLLIISIAFILIGLSKYFWFCFEYIGNPDYNKYNAYYNTGQRLVLGGVISYALFSVVDQISVFKKEMIEIVLFVAFAIATVIGLYQMVTESGRIDFYLGFATDSAYMYSAISICTIIYLHDKKSLLLKSLSVIALGLSLIIIFKSGTRNILICYPIILITSLLAWHKISKFSIITCASLFVIAFSLGYNKYIKPKIDVTAYEINRYQTSNGNLEGSLTSRLAMWEVGYEAFKYAPLSMSFEQREAFFKNYVEETNQNRAALRFVNIHLHNEIIDTASLQGIPGLISLFLAYTLLLIACFKTRNNALLGITLTIITVGLSDVVFISREQTIFFTLLMILVTVRSFHNKKEMAT